MKIFSKPRLVMAWQNCRNALAEIAHNLAASELCAQDEFMQMADKEESEQINDLLEKAIVKYTGQTNTVYGLTLYCQKFGIPVEQGADEKSLLLLINANAAEIGKQLNDAGVKE